MKKIAIIYSSRTGNTKKVAEYLYGGESERFDLFAVEESPKLDDYDFIAFGFWVDRGGPFHTCKPYMKTITGKTIFLFQTLGAEAMGNHAMTCMASGGAALGEDCHVIGTFSCRGAIEPALIEMMKKMPAGSPHAATEENMARWASAASHPDEEDLKAAKEAFEKAIVTYERYYMKK